MDGATAARFEMGIAEAGVFANAVPRATVAARYLRVMGDTPFPLLITNEGRAVGVPIGVQNLDECPFRAAILCRRISLIIHEKIKLGRRLCASAGETMTRCCLKSSSPRLPQAVGML